MYCNTKQQDLFILVDEEKQGALDNVEARREKGGWWRHTRQVGEDGLSLKHELTGNNGAVTSL